ncbi:hypothetical protein [Maritalea porphyrae]|uniref:Uncharacterized protein n=1 Tax=Maritalea porphyrae TaxID=880732 RepID=A0ABQ5UNT4_9HYPH|nr:hypothetical protein [Maritalea porphyrae]GLQ16711.1 hypothetical protein GCM10007879_09600 [Maritalea porphyrae]
MEGDYNFWKDFFDTYQSLSDWMKFAWLIVPPAFTLGLVSLIMRSRIERNGANHGRTGKLVYSVYRDKDDQFQIVTHMQEFDVQPTILLLDPPNREPHAPQNPTRRT